MGSLFIYLRTNGFQTIGNHAHLVHECAILVLSTIFAQIKNQGAKIKLIFFTGSKKASKIQHPYFLT